MEVDTQAAAAAAAGDELRRLLAATLSPDKAAVDAATAGLAAAADPRFPFALLAVAAGEGDQGIRIAAATYLKNFTRRNMEGLSSSEVYKEFRDQLAQALLRVQPAILRVLIEVFRQVIEKDFVKENLWPELVPQLKLVIQSSNMISPGQHPEWNTINVLTVLQSVVRPFQYFLNPKVANEPVPEQLEHIAAEILVPLQVSFHHFADKVLLSHDGIKLEYEHLLLSHASACISLLSTLWHAWLLTFYHGCLIVVTPTVLKMELQQGSRLQKDVSLYFAHLLLVTGNMLMSQDMFPSDSLKEEAP